MLENETPVVGSDTIEFEQQSDNSIFFRINDMSYLNLDIGNV